MWNEKILKFAVSCESEINGSCDEVWKAIHDVEKFPDFFSGVYCAEAVGGTSLSLGHKRRITRFTPTGHFFMAEWTMIQCDNDVDQPFPRSCQFYAQEFPNGNASTTWSVKPLRKGKDPRNENGEQENEGNETNLSDTDKDIGDAFEENKCILEMSFAMVPRSFFMILGKALLAPFFKIVARKAVNQDLMDFAQYFEKLNGDRTMNKKKQDEGNISSSMIVDDDVQSTTTRSTNKSGESATPAAPLEYSRLEEMLKQQDRGEEKQPI